MSLIAFLRILLILLQIIDTPTLIHTHTHTQETQTLRQGKNCEIIQLKKGKNIHYITLKKIMPSNYVWKNFDLK